MDLRDRVVLGLQRAVVATSFPPFKQLYVALYKGVIWWVGRQLAKDSFVGAVYVRHGCARGEIAPGISDIDLVMIVRDGGAHPQDAHFAANNMKEYRARYDALYRRFPMLDRLPWIYLETRLEENSMTGFQDRFILLEGRANWRLLQGRDYLPDLPDLPPKIRHGTLVARGESRWRMLFLRFFEGSRAPRDAFGRNSLCYRFCLDVIKETEMVRSGRLRFGREEVLPSVLPRMEEVDRAWIERLIGLKAGGFTAAEPAVVDQSKNFILSHLDRFYGDLAGRAYVRPLKELRHRIDCPAEEQFDTAAENRQVERLVGHIESRWGDRVRGAYLVPSVFFAPDDVLLLIQVDPQCLPTIEQLMDLFSFHREGERQLRRTIRLYLLLPNAAFHIGVGRVMQTGWHSALQQTCFHSVFSLLKRAEFALRQGTYPVWAEPALTPQGGCFFWSQKLRFRQHLESWEAAEWAGLDFLRVWWKCLQLVVVNQSIESEEMVYPLTLPAIERGLDEMGAARPDLLRPLAAAYRREVAGETADINGAIPEAVDYVRSVDPRGDIYSGPPEWLQ